MSVFDILFLFSGWIIAGVIVILTGRKVVQNVGGGSSSGSSSKPVMRFENNCWYVPYTSYSRDYALVGNIWGGHELDESAWLLVLHAETFLEYCSYHNIDEMKIKIEGKDGS